MVHAPRLTPLQNRVLPTNELVAHPARGMFMGNRGRIHRPDLTLSGRRWTTTTWVTCLLSFKNRHRQVWRTGYTELFFHDEAVALAAGHRPCAECRRADYRRFQAAWQVAHRETPTAPAMNARMHADRTAPHRTARLAALPHGCFILHQDQPALIADDRLHAFDPAGYRPIPSPPSDTEVTVLTPRCTVAALAAGYRPALHPSAAPSS